MVSAKAFVMGHFINDDARALIRSFLAASATVCAAAKRSLGLEATQVMPSLLASCLSAAPHSTEARGSKELWQINVAVLVNYDATPQQSVEN